MHPPRTSAQWFALLAGAFLVSLGTLTLIYDRVGFGATDAPAEFLIWQASGWNTILWIAFGAAGLLMSARVAAAQLYGLLVAVCFGVLALWGALDGGLETMGVFAIGTVGNITHAVLAALGLVAGTAPQRLERHHRPEHDATGPRLGV